MFYLVVGKHEWNRLHFQELLGTSEGNWRFCSSKNELSEALSAGIKFRYVFFLHWSDKVEPELIATTECVCFHMTDVPYGRGGSPLQNLISRGHRETKITALRMTSSFDAGPVYLKESFSLEGGTAEEIFMRASRISCQMALQIAKTESQPVEQSGEVTVFKRRTQSQSEITVENQTLLALFDHIRMLDADGYPKAFISSGGFRFEFSRAALYHGELKADVTITKESDKT